MALSNWRVGNTKEFSGRIKLNGTYQNITGDSVTLRLKTNKDDTDANAVLTKTADVITYGSTGTYKFYIRPVDTYALTTRKYHYDLIWITSAKKSYTLEEGQIVLLERVSDALPLTTTTTTTTT